MIPLTLHNSISTIDDSGWALIAPFGEHPKTRIYRDQTASGRNIIREQKYIQVLDQAAADALIARENSLFRTLKRALIGIPIYKGHGDLADHDPKAVSSDREKVKLGVVTRIRKSARGIEARFALDADGAAAVAAGWKLPSAFWWVQPLPSLEGNNGRNVNYGNPDAIRCRPFKLISVALTQFPNISGVESLANSITSRRDPNPAGTDLAVGHQRANPTSQISGSESPAAAGSECSRGQETTTTHTEPDMKLIAGWLIGQGFALANTESPTETQVLEAIKSALTAKTGEVTALGNENSTLAGQISTLETEITTERTKTTEATTALVNEQVVRKAERRGRAMLAADLAIQRGKLTVAKRDAAIAVLENSANFDTDAGAMLAAPNVIKIAGQDTESGKVLANEHDLVMAEYDREFKAQLALYNQDPVRAHTAVMAKCPALGEKLKVKRS